MPSRPKKRKDRPKATPAGESRIAEVATVGWMLTTMTTLVCEIGVALARIGQSIWPAAQRAGILADLLLLVAVMFGAISLVLTAICFRIRRTAPPKAVSVFALIVAIAPFIGLLIRLR